MCMAELFAALEPHVPFALAHCNFHLRGEESDGDEALVRTWASERGVRIHVRDFDTETYARENGISIEMLNCALSMATRLFPWHIMQMTMQRH